MTRISRIAGIGVVLALAATALVYYLFFYGVRPGPSFIDKLHSGQIVPQDVTQVQILHFNPSGGWPFREDDYSALQRVSLIDRSKIESLLAVLKTNSTIGIQPRNHPATVHWGILRAELQSGEHFYLYYQIERDETGDFASVAANSANSTNPNGAKHYESTAVVSLLRSEDPWFQKE